MNSVDTSTVDVFAIPFNKYIGFEPSTDPAYLMVLPARAEYENHVQTVHASALFALAEATSGLFLLREFVEVENVVSVVRVVSVKYKKPGKGAIRSKASLATDKTEVLETLQKKRPVLVPVQVSLYDGGDVLVMSATFEWFVLIKSE